MIFTTSQILKTVEKNSIILNYLAHSNRTSSKISSITVSDKDDRDSTVNYSYQTNRTQKVITETSNLTNDNIKKKHMLDQKLLSKGS